MSPSEPSPAMSAFAEEVGASGPVRVEGGATRPTLGGTPDAAARTVTAPRGVLDVRPDELVVVLGAGTPVAELESELARVGQTSGLAGPPGCTVGGCLAVGHSSVHSYGMGPVRDVLLGVGAVDCSGRVVRAGGATVKNVSGFDLCRLWVGSLGTLALFGEVTLRTRPLPAAAMWVTGAADRIVVDALVDRCSTATSILWDGARAWVHLAGHPEDVRSQKRLLATLGVGEDADGPPRCPPHRTSIDPARLADLRPGDGGWLAEVGVGIVHREEEGQAAVMTAAQAALHRAVKGRFDPTGRLNPGRSVLAGVRVLPEPVEGDPAHGSLRPPWEG